MADSAHGFGDLVEDDAVARHRRKMEEIRFRRVYGASLTW